MKKPVMLVFVILGLLAACQPAPSVTPTELPTAVVTDLPTTGDLDTATAEATTDLGAAMTAEATSDLGAAMTAEATTGGEPATSTDIPPTAEATADTAAMLPVDYCLEITGLEDTPVVLRMNAGTYTYEFEGPAGAESTTGAAPNTVPISLHTLRFQEAGGQYEFILTFSDEIALGAYPLGTTQMAALAAGMNVTAEATAEGTADASTSANTGTGANSPNTNTGAGGAGSGTGATGSEGAQATSEAGMIGSVLDSTPMPVVLTGECANLGMEATAEATMSLDGGMVTAEATSDSAAVGQVATVAPLATEGSTGDAAAETLPAPAAQGTATEVNLTSQPGAGDSTAEATADVGADQPLDVTPASPAEPSDINAVTVIGARLEATADTGTDYIVLQSGTLEISGMEQQADVTVISGRFNLVLAAAEATGLPITVTGYFTDLPLTPSPR